MMKLNFNKFVQSYGAYSTVVLRVGLAIVFLWFGVNQVLNPAVWTGWLPMWFTNILPFSPQTFIFLNGGIEIISGLFLLMGMFTRAASLIIIFNLIGIITVIGYNDIAIRDLGLLAAALSLFLSQSYPFSIDNIINKKIIRKK